MGLADPTAARRELVAQLRAVGEIRSDDVARAIDTVPRHEFVPDAHREHAYEDRPLDIGEGQVATAPHLVARMTELLAPTPGDRVLEIGTGSGYHTAVLAELAGPTHVSTVERFPTVGNRARRVLETTGYGETTVLVGDGSCGLDRPAVDCLSVAAAAPSVPDSLVEQLRSGGRLVIPVGPRDGLHELVALTADDGDIERTTHGRVKFVPLVGECGFEEQ